MLHVDSKKETDLGLTVSMFPYIYVMLSVNFQFADETSHKDVWTIVNGKLQFSEV